MKKRRVNLLVYILIIVFGFVIINLIYSFFIYETVGLNMHLNVAERLGFNITKEYQEHIYFGTIPPEGEGSKDIFVQNTDYKKTRVIIKAYGKLGDWITVSENNFFMKKGESKIIWVKVNPPSDAEYKQYYGKLKIMFLRF